MGNPVALPLVFVGAASNQAVIVANHGTFPVQINAQDIEKFHPDEDGMIDREHCVMTSKTHLNYLADIIRLDGIESIGDLLIDAGDATKGTGLVIGTCVVLFKKDE